MSNELEKKLEKYGVILVFENVYKIEYDDKHKAMRFVNMKDKCSEDYIENIVGLFVFKDIKNLLRFLKKWALANYNSVIAIIPSLCSWGSFTIYNAKYVFAKEDFREIYIIL